MLPMAHGYERIHMHALRPLGELLTAYLSGSVRITRDFQETADLEGFTCQETDSGKQSLTPDSSVRKV